MEKPIAGPLRAFRDRYVAGYVGVSYDLAPRVIGIHPANARFVPELPGRRVLVQAERAHARLTPAFTVVALDRMMRNARELAEQGGVVFSSFDLEDPDVAPLLAHADRGDAMYLNAALERLPDEIVRRPRDLSAA